MQTEEYAPQITPTIRGAANSRMEDTPRMYRTATITNVVKEVYILLVSVCVILSLTISSSFALLTYDGKHAGNEGITYGNSGDSIERKYNQNVMQ